MNKKLSNFYICLGLLFILNTIFGRYIVLPGYLAGLEQGTGTLEGASQVVSTWKILRYLLWAYSFKFGIYFIILGALFRTNISSKKKWIVAIGGLIYISFAYMPLPNPSSIIFGIAGGFMTAVMIFIILQWSNKRIHLPNKKKFGSDYRIIGYFFFAMATYTLCPLLGVKTFALQPEKMIEFGLQAEAASFAYHLLIELVLGWAFTLIAILKENQNE